MEMDDIIKHVIFLAFWVVPYLFKALRRSDDDIAVLKEAGLAEIFTPGTPLTTISAWVDDNLRDD